MPFAMKIQPIDSEVTEEGIRVPEVVKPVAKSWLKRIFERPFHGVPRNSTAAGKIIADESHSGNDDFVDFEPSSVCLAKMVQSFMEGNHDKHSVSTRSARNRRNCFNGICDDISDADYDAIGGFNEASKILKGLVACASVCERNLLADTTKIVDKNKMICKRKDNACRKIVTEGLVALGYDASICNSRWEKSPFHPAGEYEYIDVIIEDERMLVDIDFKSEFEIARPTKVYRDILQNLPYIFVGKCDRLQSIVTIVSEAAKQSLKKKGMHVPPWRKVEYVKAKWISPYTRVTPSLLSKQRIKEEPRSGAYEFELSHDKLDESVLTLSESSREEGVSHVVFELKPPELKPRSSQSGLAAVFMNEK